MRFPLFVLQLEMLDFHVMPPIISTQHCVFN